jgi:hypothetical protein
VLGDPRTNQNPALLAFGILFFRWHNVVAGRVQAQHPDWPDEEVFQRARRIVVATLQVNQLQITKQYDAFASLIRAPRVVMGISRWKNTSFYVWLNFSCSVI